MRPTLYVMLAAELLLLGALPRVADAIPYFARRYDVPCSRCHVSPPKLNAFGEAFIARGYEMPGLRARSTVPFALWVSGRSDSPPPGGTTADQVRAYINRVEIISG